jgi:hypothetical protein
MDFKQFTQISGYHPYLHVQTLGEFHCFPSEVTFYFDDLKDELHGGYLNSIMAVTPSQTSASQTVVDNYARTNPADLAEIIIALQKIANTLTNGRGNVNYRIQQWAYQHLRIPRMPMSEARAQKRWPPSLPWDLPSQHSLTLPSRCILCWNLDFCLCAANGHPYESTHGMDITPDPEVGSGVLSDTSADGRGPERLCVVCGSKPGGCELCK